MSIDRRSLVVATGDVLVVDGGWVARDAARPRAHALCSRSDRVARDANAQEVWWQPWTLGAEHELQRQQQRQAGRTTAFSRCSNLRQIKAEACAGFSLVVVMQYELNGRIADRLRAMADLREQQGDDGFRVRAYRRAAETIVALDEPLDLLLAKGREGLIELPTIGEGIAAAIAEMVATGRWAQLDRLTGALDPEHLFQSIPGVGPKLAARLHENLGLDTLEQLEIAAHDGRLDSAEGFGPRRAAAIRLGLNERLGWPRIRRRSEAAPPVSMVFALDAAYRRADAAGKLKRISPKRFNPSGEAWLSIMHADRRRWRFTALYSNTARAHALGKTRDWVVLYFHTDASPESQCTVVTETRGPLKGLRVIRGRENECAAHYAAMNLTQGTV